MYEALTLRPTPLGVLQVIYALLALGDTTAEDGIMESGIAIRCLDLFTQFPFNNLLHHRVRYCDIASVPTLQQVSPFAVQVASRL